MTKPPHTTPHSVEVTVSDDFGSRYRLGENVAVLSIGISAALAALKIYTGVLWGSTALTADGFESASDIVASIVVLSGMSKARRAPDAMYPYGYGRAESLAGRTVATILIIFSVLIAFKSVRAMFDPGEAPPLIALAPLAVSFAAKGMLAAWKKRLGQRLGSTSLKADAANDLVDMLSATVAGIGVTCAALAPGRLAFADPLGGLAVGAIIFLIGYRIFRETSRELMDAMPEADFVECVRRVALSVNGVRDVEKIVGRKAGMDHFFDLHLWVDPTMPVAEAHYLGHQVQDAILAAYPSVRQVLVHLEPDLNDPRTPQRNPTQR
ncbi:MAG: cation diffusion facilitator family transporter [Candidatus Sumerlaeaceae bacterium]|nr:cation diffusion facilitator family transporter [Candidatus Sumerlaeaceae bacterium]